MNTAYSSIVKKDRQLYGPNVYLIKVAGVDSHATNRK